MVSVSFPSRESYTDMKGIQVYHKTIYIKTGVRSNNFGVKKFQLYAVSVHFPQRFRGAQVFYKHLLFVLHCFFFLEIKINLWFRSLKELNDNFIVNPNKRGLNQLVIPAM